MIELHTPNGLKSMVPENEDEDTTPRFNVENNLEEGVKYYKDKGYVIFDSCVTKENCDKLRDLWEKIIKPYKRTNKHKIFIAYYLGSTRLIDNI